MSFSKISVIGLGYIGLPTAAVFGAHQVEVIGVDVDPMIVDTINQGKVHIVEPDLDAVVQKGVETGVLRATLTPETADAFLIAVPTPFIGEGHDPDLRYIQAAATAIAPVLVTGNLVILESTSPVGATEKMAQWLAQARPDLTFPDTHGESSDIRIAYCPERVLPGHVLRELIENDRVIGGMTPKCADQAVALYNTFLQGSCFITDCRTAEMAKLTENSFRDVNIAFANELSMICEPLGINVWELIRLANRHPRVNILQPGPGVGGHCIAVDPWFIVSKSPDEAKLIRLAREVNDHKPTWVLGKLQEAVSAHLKAFPGKIVTDVSVGLLGLAFKPNVDDLRESPAMQIAETVVHSHAGPVLICEPHIEQLPAGLGKARLIGAQDCVQAADVVVLLVDHQDFETITMDELTNKQIVDTRGNWT